MMTSRQLALARDFVDDRNISNAVVNDVLHSTVHISQCEHCLEQPASVDAVVEQTVEI